MHLNLKHFINYAGGTGSYDNFNTYHIDTRFVFHTIGDQEYYSASFDNATSFEDHTRFYNRRYITDNFHSNANYDGKSFGTQEKAKTSFQFITSASNNSKIKLRSTDGTTITYMALNSRVNGTLSSSFDAAQKFIIYEEDLCNYMIHE